MVIVEVEGVLNGRPLLYLSEEKYCSSLTPNISCMVEAYLTVAKV